MGIGYALASGLVQGFTQNIGREMERRAGEKEKLEAYRLAIANAAITGGEDFNATNAKLIGDMVSKADARYKEQGGIDIFGTKGDSIFGDEAEEFDTLLNSFTSGKVATASLPITSTFDLTDYMSPDLVERLEKDRGNPTKLGTIVMQGLDQAVKKLGEDEFAAQFTGAGDLDNLRGFFNTHMQGVLTPDMSAPGATAGLPSDPERLLKGITNYDYFDNLLGLSKSKGRNNTFITKRNIASDSTMYVPGDERMPDEFTVLSGTVAGQSHTAMNSVVIPVGVLTESDIDVNLLSRVAEAQGRTFDDYLYHVSSNYSSQAGVIEGLQHISKLSEGLFVGGKMDFASMDKLIFMGDYLDNNVESPSDQIRLINAVQGTVLTESKQFAIDNGFATVDDYIQGTDRESAFKASFGGSFQQFKERVEAARRASSRLKDYFDIVKNIKTVNETALDSLASFVNSIFDTGGSIDQIVDLVIGDDESYTGDRQQLSSALQFIFDNGGAGNANEINTTKGLRAKRDSLAFIIAADMARAEDPSGRLSDGDLQRNLQKLTGRGFRTKVGEIRALIQVRDTFLDQVDMLSGIESRVEIEGATGFSVDLQDEIRAMKTRDLALAAYNGQQPLMSVEDTLETSLSGPVTAEMIMSTTNKFGVDPQFKSDAGDVYVALGTFDQFYVISPDPDDATKGTIVAQGSKKRLMDNGDIRFVPITSGTSSATPDNNALPAPDNNTNAASGATSAPVVPDNSTVTSNTTGGTQSGTVVFPDTGGVSGTGTVVTRPGSLGDGTVLTLQNLIARGIDPSKDRKVLPPSQGGGYTFTGIDGVYDIETGPSGVIYVKRPDANAGTQGAN
jgi:hypothetical protein